MDRIQQFWETVQREMTALLATSADGQVTMRMVSPVRNGNTILIFTGKDSVKYRQLTANPGCCISVGPFFAEARATFCGPTLLPENQPLRDVYSVKFPGAFDEGIAFGGRQAEFLLLHPTRLTGWAFENDTPTAGGIPTIPFSLPFPEDTHAKVCNEEV